MEIKFRNLYADEIEVRVGNVIDTAKFQGATLLLYKNARVDMQLLDEVVGCMNWKREHTRDNANCIVSIWDSEKKQWVSKEDTGTESYTEKEKGLSSDSFKRACVNWGIGRSLYSAPTILITCELKEKKGKKVPVINDFYVKEIEYDEKNNICKLIICYKDKWEEKELFNWSAKPNKQPQKPREDKQPKKQTEIEHNNADEKFMDRTEKDDCGIIEALQYKFVIAGAEYTLDDCPIEWLEKQLNNARFEFMFDKMKKVLEYKKKHGENA